MGLKDSVDNWVHGGIPKPESYERKKLYNFGEELGTTSKKKKKKLT
jgi:hypothetical protein